MNNLAWVFEKNRKLEPNHKKIARRSIDGMLFLFTLLYCLYFQIM